MARPRVKPDALLADMRKRAVRTNHTQCAFGRALEEMTPTARRVVEQAAAEGIGAGSIVDSLTAAGLNSSAKSTAHKHLKGKCQCPRN